jgi:hypothetical protein
MRVLVRPRVRHGKRHLTGMSDSRSIQQLRLLRQSGDCTRCGGLLVQERMDGIDYYLFEQQGPALRCVQCGDLIDPVILSNRVA